MDVTETHQDVLQNVEFAIVTAHDDERDLLDLEVLDALDAVIRRYGAESQGRQAPAMKLSGRTAAAYSLVHRMCEWRMGRESLGGEEGTDPVALPEVVTIEALLACLRRVRKSAKFWNESGGRQGYLGYIRQFMPQV